MKRIISLILAISIVSGVFHLDELTKVSSLRNHYDHYIRNGGENGLAKFLFLHYLTDTNVAADHSEHEKLPFKSDKGLQAHISVFDASDKTEFRFIMSCLPLMYPEIVPGLSYCEVKIFQPPRFV